MQRPPDINLQPLSYSHRRSVLSRHLAALVVPMRAESTVGDWMRAGTVPAGNAQKRQIESIHCSAQGRLGTGARCC